MPRRFLGFGLFICSFTACFAAEAQARLEDVNVLKNSYPRAFFFRRSEALASQKRVSYEQWDGLFNGLDGIMGKCLDEEIPGRSLRNIDFFTRFKQDHPNQTVLLHFNGNARDPRFETEPYFAGHWLYHEGCRITAELKAAAESTTVHVEDTSLFLTDIGRFGDKNEDLAMCMLGPDGKPDWSRAEQVELVSIDDAAKTLEVRRGAFGTAPLVFPGGKAYIAAHASEGPWGKNAHLLWNYNHSSTCPRDKDGLQCTDRLLDDLERWFGEGGPLAVFDGLEFDVLSFHAGRAKRRARDANADGVGDRGYVDGVNVYGLGVHRFLTRLRARLGEDRLIMADGHSEWHQRSVPILNGIESEGWPTLMDPRLSDWSGGLNRHAFWTSRAREPRLSYINHKFMENGDRLMVPSNISRLVLAAAQFTDTAFTYSQEPPVKKGQRVGVWDELCKGEEKQLRWLGRPLAAAEHLGFRTPNLLGAQETAWRSGDALLREEGATVLLSPRDAAQTSMRAVLPGIELPEGDLLVRCTVQGEPDPALPAGLPRLLWFECQGHGHLISSHLPTAYFGVRGKGESPLPEHGKGARIAYQGVTEFNVESHEAYFTHPPYGPGQGPGYLAWEHKTTIPKKPCTLHFFTGLKKAPNPSDGVLFAVDLVDAKGTHRIHQGLQTEYNWQGHQTDLGKWAGQEVTLRFISDCGPADKTTADHAYWGDVEIRLGNRPFLRPEHTRAKLMTWMDSRPFEATFYFRDVGGSVVDLAIQAEGAAAVSLSNLRVCAAPDVMAREFEHGVVLANPSSRPYSFDLAALYPGRAFRRLKGREEQAPAVNNGQRVGTHVELPANDALFLVKE